MMMINEDDGDDNFYQAYSKKKDKNFYFDEYEGVVIHCDKKDINREELW